MSVQIIQAEEELPEDEAATGVAEVEEEWDGAKEAKAAGLPPRAVLHRNGTVDLTLRDQLDVTIGTNVTSYQTLKFGRLKGKHMKDLAKASVEDTLALAMSFATGLTSARSNLLLDEMDAADQRAVSQVVRFLNGAGDLTGR